MDYTTGHSVSNEMLDDLLDAIERIENGSIRDRLRRQVHALALQRTDNTHSAAMAVEGLQDVDAQILNSYELLRGEVERANGGGFSFRGMPPRTPFGQPRPSDSRPSFSPFGRPRPSDTFGSRPLFGQPRPSDTYDSVPSFGRLRDSDTYGGGSLFGQPTGSNAYGGGSLFGQPRGSNTFGGGSLFGQPTSSNAFAGGSLFGQPRESSTYTGGSLFGQPRGSSGGSLFGGRPTASNTHGGGSTYLGQPVSGGSLFGGQPNTGSDSFGKLFADSANQQSSFARGNNPGTLFRSEAGAASDKKKIKPPRASPNIPGYKPAARKPQSRLSEATQQSIQFQAAQARRNLEAMGGLKGIRKWAPQFVHPNAIADETESEDDDKHGSKAFWGPPAPPPQPPMSQSEKKRLYDAYLAPQKHLTEEEEIALAIKNSAHDPNGLFGAGARARLQQSQRARQTRAQRVGSRAKESRAKMEQLARERSARAKAAAPPANAPVNRFSPFTSAPATFYAPP
ncbi:hypothetical protein HDK77DRAFT_484964 [Phyllosticta capitalensis]|uniref:Uncharacterized protein n=1 Tax=Phyllosticta capitalensis TaxID=121624 RepID=A0ABR1YJA0_9PEZI